MSDEPKITVRSVPMLDTGLGREAGFANDAEFIDAAKKQRGELEELLTPQALARFDAAEDEIMRQFLFGDGGKRGGK